jgi:hypothetical protein
MKLLVKEIPKPIKNSTPTFWQCFNHALEDNKKNCDGKHRVLSIIADDFTYKELQENLGVSNCNALVKIKIIYQIIQ